MSTQITKVIVLLTLLVSTFIFSMIPVKFFSVTQRQMDPVKRRRYKSIMSLLSCFAAGVFLATCLLDLFPQVRDNLQKGFDSANINTSYPVAEFILVCGLFFILIAEQLVLTVKDNRAHAQGSYKPLSVSVDSAGSYSDS